MNAALQACTTSDPHSVRPMTDTAINVEGIGKKYRLGRTERYKSLRESLVSAATAPFRRFRAAANGRADDQTFWALKDVSFDVVRGEVIGIIGRNGAGKSTLLKILSRITEPTEGRIRIRGRVGSLLEVGTGFHPELTGRENIYMNGAILGMHRWEITEKFDDIVEFAEVESFIDTPVKRYSSGMYMRLAFAVAAHMEPEILIVDEVLAVGDAQFQKKCLGKMGDVARHGRTVLFVSHNMEAVVNLCSKAVLLERGRVVRIGPTGEVIQQYRTGLLDRGMDFRRRATEQRPAISIDHVELANSHGPSTLFDVSEGIQLTIDYTVNEVLNAGFLAFQVRTSMGQQVFTSTNADLADDSLRPDGSSNVAKRTRAGKAVVTIPPELLNVGVYELHVASFSPGRDLLDLVTDAMFEVCDNGSFASRPFLTAREGIVLRRLPWELNP